MSDLSKHLSKKSHTDSDNSNLEKNTEDYYTVFDYYTKENSNSEFDTNSSPKNTGLIKKLTSSINNNIHTIGLSALLSLSILTYFVEKELSKFKQFYGEMGLFESNIYLENTYDLGSISKGYGSLNKLTSISIFPDTKIVYIDGIDEISASDDKFYDSQIEEVQLIVGSDSSKLTKYYSSNINSNTVKGVELNTMFKVWNFEYNIKRRILYLKEHPPQKEKPQLHLVKNEIRL